MTAGEPGSGDGPGATGTTGPESVPTAPSSDADRRSGRSAPRPGSERRSGIDMTPAQLAARRNPRPGEGPVLSVIAIAVSALLALALLGMGYSHSSTRTAPLVGAFHQTGAFSYAAPVIAPTAVYPTGVVTTGQPIYPSLVTTVAMTFRYTFSSPLPHDVHGTIGFDALLLSQTDTWQNVSTIHPTSEFTGDHTTVTSRLALSDLYGFVASVSQQSEVASTTYSADLQPIVHLTGVVGGQRINEVFEPVLPFTVTQSVITLAVAAAVAPPGATYAVPSASAEQASTLNPVQVGSIPHQVPNTISVTKFQVNVGVARVLGIIFAALALILVGVDEYFRRRATRRSDEELLAAKMHLLVVPVASLGEPRQRATIDVERFAYLARLAEYLERPILYQLAGSQRTFAVDDEVRQYRYRASAEEPSGSDPAGSGHPGSGRFGDPDRSARPPTAHRERRTWRSLLARGAAMIGVIALAATLVTGFTASTNVPVSSAGTSQQIRLVSQLAPAGCGSLNLSRLVTGSGAFSNNLADALLLGSSGSDTITDTGGDSCIVGGGGVDTVTGVPTDICISGPSLNVAAPCPAANPSNGVAIVPSSDNYNNYGGQERLSFTNTSVVTAMTITIRVAQTPGVSFNSQANSFPGGTLTQSSGVVGGAIVYSYVLAAGASIPANYPGGVVYAQFSGTGTPRVSTGDTWTVTSTSGGRTSTLTGTF